MEQTWHLRGTWLGGIRLEVRKLNASHAIASSLYNLNHFYSISIADHEQAHIYEVGRPVALRGEAWYHAGISREMAEQQLENTPNGYFLVRESETKSGCFSLSLKHPGGIAHFRIEKKDSGLYEIPGTHESFATLLDLINHFKHNSISEHPHYKLISPCDRAALLGGELKWELDACSTRAGMILIFTVSISS